MTNEIEKTRRIRIVSKPHNVLGWYLVVTDANTGEEIKHIYRIEVLLDAREFNMAYIYYYKQDAQGHKYIDADTGKSAKGVHLCQFPELDVYAYTEDERPEAGQ